MQTYSSHSISVCLGNIASVYGVWDSKKLCLYFKGLASDTPLAIAEEEPSTNINSRNTRWLWVCLSLQISDGCILIPTSDF